MLSEFGGVEPDPRLICILQHLRDKTGVPVKITDGPRTPKQIIDIYKDLQDRGKIKTLENGLGDKPLLYCIPWESRHLPIFENPLLRASDLTCKGFSGQQLADIILEYVESTRYLICLLDLGYLEKDKYIGLGIGDTYIHVDIYREKHTIWRYA